MNAAPSNQQAQDTDLFEEHDGILVRRGGVRHREEDYDPHGFQVLLKMQKEHFWYLGRHRFILRAVEKELARLGLSPDTLSAIDLGGGCGGWLEYLKNSPRLGFGELAVGDSSFRALNDSGPIVGSFAKRFQVDLFDPGWIERWDVIFLLDVLEHISEDLTVLGRLRECLTPNGLLFVTVPALQVFWSYNDEIAEHKKRYSRQDFRKMAHEAGLELVGVRYFMFLLSPLLWLSRLHRPDIKGMSREQVQELLA
jgi:hypothetical protein